MARSTSGFCGRGRWRSWCGPRARTWPWPAGRRYEDVLVRFLVRIVTLDVGPDEVLRHLVLLHVLVGARARDPSRLSWPGMCLGVEALGRAADAADLG